MGIRSTILGMTAAVMTLHVGAAFKQTGMWHTHTNMYKYYRWNSKGSMVFVKGSVSNVTISAWMSPDNQWVRTMPFPPTTSTSMVYVAADFKTLLIHTKNGTAHQLYSYSLGTTLTFLRNAGFSAETGEFGPPQFTWAGKDLFVAQRMTAEGIVLLGLVNPPLTKWKINMIMHTWGGWTPKSAPVSISPHGKYLAVERSYNVGLTRGTLDVYRVGAPLKNMGETTFADGFSWLNCPQDNFLMYRAVQAPGVWEAAKIGSLDIFCTKPDAVYDSWMVAPSGKGSAVLYTSSTKTITVRTGSTLLGPHAITDAQAGDSLLLMYFDGKTVVIAFMNGAGTKLRAYRVTAQELKRIAGPVDCGSIMYTHHEKGYFAFSAMDKTFTVYSPKLKVIGQTTGGIPTFKGRSALLADLSVTPTNEFKIFRW